MTLPEVGSVLAALGTFKAHCPVLFNVAQRCWQSLAGAILNYPCIDRESHM